MLLGCEVGGGVSTEQDEGKELRELAGRRRSAISTDWLRALPSLHLPPIEQVFYLRPYLVKPGEVSS